jgi:hypothetical protein
MYQTGGRMMRLASIEVSAPLGLFPLPIGRRRASSAERADKGGAAWLT